MLVNGYRVQILLTKRQTNHGFSPNAGKDINILIKSRIK